MVVRRRTGSAALLLIAVAVAGSAGYLYTQPDVAQDVLPPSALPMLPQFEKVETDRSCGIIDKGTDFWNTLPLNNVTKDEAKTLFCLDRCGGEEFTVAGVCTGDEENTLDCICRMEDA